MPLFRFNDIDAGDRIDVMNIEIICCHSVQMEANDKKNNKIVSKRIHAFELAWIMEIELN